MTEQELLPAITPPGETRWVELRNPALELAREIANTDFVPRGLRGNPHAILACILYGDEIGLGPMTALAHIAVIDGRPSQSAEIQRASILRAGHKIWIVEATTTKVTIAGQRAGDEQTSTVTWTMDDAKRARLDGKTNWRTYPRAMLTARASAELARVLFPDVIGGMAATEEVQDDGTLESTGAEIPSGAGGEPAAGSSTRRRRRSPEPPPEAPQPPAAADPDTQPDPGAADTAQAASPAQPTGEDAELERLDRILEPAERELAELGATRVDDPSALDVAAASERKPAENLADQARAAAAEPEHITDPQRRKMNALFREAPDPVTARASRLAYCTKVAGREITSSNELTVEEAGRVIDHLERWKADPAGGPFQDGIPY